MKARVLAITAIAAMLACALCACAPQNGPSNAASSSKSESPAAASSSAAASASAPAESAATSAQPPTVELETMQDAFDAPGEAPEMTVDDGRFIMGFHDGGWYYRVVAELPDDVKSQLDGVLPTGDKLTELLAPLPVSKTEVLAYPSEADYQSYIGMSGAELADEGFSFIMLRDRATETECTAQLGSFQYVIVFDGTVEDENTADIAGAVENLTAKSVEVDCLTWDALAAE